MKYCKFCVCPISAVNMRVDEEGVCSSCRTFEKFTQITDEEWTDRRQRLESVLEQVKANSQGANYDCLIPVSGGKDSYFQAHVIVHEFGLKPLLMTYHGNNFLPEGDFNRDRMRKVFDADHLIWGPSVEVLKKLNRMAFRKMGDMNWQNHCGILSAPIQVAVKFKIPLVIWGEIAWDISGMHEPKDFVEFSAQVRHEHGLRGYEWDDFINDPNESISEKDMLWSKYPTDEEIISVGVKGLYIGNYFKWDPNQHYKQMMKLYGWKQAEKPFDRTYRRHSNLDDRYENGIHDLMKFVKFGYGRATDHASKDIRDGYMTREKGIEMVQKYDHVVSEDLQYWLNYVDMSEEEFWRIADTFRDSRVWNIQDGLWWKDDIWGGRSSYGPVHLSEEKIAEFKKARTE
jgi:N-acetyl sugar amidotransferase